MWWMIAAAMAAEPTQLGPGDLVGYSGAGVSTFATGSSGLDRDRQLRPRVDLYGAAGLGRALQLSVYTAGVGATVLGNDEGPCPTNDDYCDTTLSLGQLGVRGRRVFRAGTVSVGLELAIEGDPWNVGTRHRWSNVGQGTVDLGAALLIGARWGQFSIAGEAYPSVMLWGPGNRARSDDAYGRLLADWRQGPVTTELAVSGGGRIGGVPFGPEWIEDYLRTDDAWIALRYQEVAVGAKLSLALSDRTGLHLQLRRVVWANSGPRDNTDVSLGAHVYLPGGRRDKTAP